MNISKRAKNLTQLIAVVLMLNSLLYGLFLSLDITVAHPWRQTDSQAEITAYANGSTDFLHPVVNAPATQWGPGLIEIPLPIFQYLSAQLSNLLRPYWVPFVQKETVGILKLPPRIKALDYSERKTVEGSKLSYKVNFVLRPGITYRVVSFFKPQIRNFLHLYLVTNLPIEKQKSCVQIINRRPNLLGPVPYWEQANDYCYQSEEVPIVYMPLQVGKNEVEFIFEKSMAPENIESAFSLFSESTYATPELMSARIINIAILSGTAIILACTFFPVGYFRIAAALALSVIPAFGYFAYFIHEEMLAFLFIAIFLWMIFRKGLTTRWIILSAISLSLATAIRPYYGLYGLVLAALAFYQDGIRVFLKPAYYLAAIITVLPASLWYSWTQYLVSHGADTIAIFNDRIVWGSLLKWELWKEYIKFFVFSHFTLPVLVIFILSFIATLWLSFKKIIQFSLDMKIFLAVGAFINLIIVPLIFDSAAVHNYYQFPITAFIVLAALICLFQLYNSIKNRVKANCLLVVVFGFIVLSGVCKVLNDFAKSLVGQYDSIDFAVIGGVVGELFQPDAKVVLLDSGGPQAFGITNRNGRRDKGYYSGYPFKSPQDLEQYLVEWYGPVSTYKGLTSCETALHRLETFEVYKDYVRSDLLPKENIRYILKTYPNCEIVLFTKN